MTINDVAKVAGVSKSTVSRYLNDGYVSKENRIKIKSAIEKTGYQTNMFARGLKTNTSHLIAIIIPRLDSYSAIQSLEGMNSVLSAKGYQMVVVPKNTIEEDEITYLKKISTQGFDAIIVMAHAITDDHVALAKSASVPILFTGQLNDQVESFALEDYEIGKLVGNYVNTLKPDNVLYLSVSESDHAVGVNRKLGLTEALKSPLRTLVSGFRQDEAYSIMKQESTTIKYDVVVGATDNIAIGILRYLKDNKISVPKDVKVIGIGNYDMASFISPSLTTLNIDYQAFGRQSAQRLLRLLGDNEPIETSHQEFKLMIRESSK